MRYRLIGAPQTGTLKNGKEITIYHGDVITKIAPVSFWHWVKTLFTGKNWYYFDDFRSEHLFLIHDSIIERYFEAI